MRSTVEALETFLECARYLGVNFEGNIFVPVPPVVYARLVEELGSKVIFVDVQREGSNESHTCVRFAGPTKYEFIGQQKPEPA